MSRSQDKETDAWRILLFARNGAELLLLRSRSGFRLPEFHIPRCQRIAPNLNAEAKRLWNLDTVCLFPLDLPHPDSAAVHCKYQVMEVRKPEELARVAPDFMLTSTSNEAAFADERDYLAVQQGMGFEGACFPKECQGPFSEFGAFGRISAWVEEQLRQLGLRWNGNVRQLQAGASFALIRFETNRGGVWFKAVGEPNLRELPITVTLAANFPEHVPEPFAQRAEWDAWLTEEVEGHSLFASKELACWHQAAEALASLQIASIQNTSHILAAGARDTRSARLLAVTGPFFAAMECIMDEQTTRGARKLSRQQIQQVQQQVIEALGKLDGAEVPDTLNHLDLNPGNVFVSSTKCKFLDWAEAAVGNPLFSMEYLRQHFLRAYPDRADAEGDFRNCYLNPWKAVLPSKTIALLLRLAPLTAAFAYAACALPWDDANLSRRTELAPLLRSLLRRMHCESDWMGTSRVA
jgi:hypothetical protein